MKIRAVLNPRAGLKARRALDALKTGRPEWPPIDVRLTEGPGDARRLSAEAVADGVDVVLAAGGDGTANEVATGLLGSNATLGIVPLGSGNGLARSLRIPLTPGRALAELEHAVPRSMDVGLANGRPFLNVAGAGFDAAVGDAFHHHGKNGGRRGVLTYVRLGAGLALRYEPPELLLRGDGQGFEGRAMLIAFANGPQYGGGAVIAPGARLDDGVLDAVVIERAPLLEVFVNAPRLFLHSIQGYRRYRRLPLSNGVLSARRPTLFHRDGEPEPAEPRFEIGLKPRALSILVPRATAEDPDGPFSALE